MLNSCGDFLQEYSKELAYATSCEDLNEVLIGNGYMNSTSKLSTFSGTSVSSGVLYYPWLHVMDDDVTEYATGNFNAENQSNPATFLRGFYAWQPDPFIDMKDLPYEDPNWKILYEHIGNLNVIISQVDEFNDDPIELRNRVRGEAEFLRGAYYFLLVNMYGLPYSKETASTDLGVPLNLTEEIEDIYYSRASVQDVYDVIVEDLTNAAAHLQGIVQPSFYRVNEVAARVLLSRVYLYMGEYELAIEECEKAIALGCPLKNLNEFDMTIVDGTGQSTNSRMEYLYSLDSPEILFTQGSSTMRLLMYDNANLNRYRVSDELLALFSKYSDEGVNDLREEAFFVPSAYDGNYYFAQKGDILTANLVAFDSYVIRTAEVYLNKAEAEAMLDDANAVSTLKTLLEYRFEDGQIPAFVEGLSGEELVKFVREERRRELCFECHRWFDLRRYAVCEKYPETKQIEHVEMGQASTSGVTGTNNGYYVLNPYGEDAAWVLPIPNYEISFNQGNMVDNAARPERSLR